LILGCGATAAQRPQDLHPSLIGSRRKLVISEDELGIEASETRLLVSDVKSTRWLESSNAVILVRGL
jgi:hypothetical protein